MFYTIGQAAKIVGLTASTLRYYDKEGLLPFVDKNVSGNRIFKESDFEWITLIQYLKATDMSIRDIKQFIDWCMEGDSSLEKRRDMFYERKKAVEDQLQKMQETLDIINYKCWFYDKAVEHGSTEKVKNLNCEEMPEKMRKTRDILTGNNK